MQGWLSHLANAGLRDYAHFGKPSPPNVQYILPMYPGNTPNSCKSPRDCRHLGCILPRVQAVSLWTGRRQLYMDLGNGVKAVNLWPVTTNGHTSPGCAVDYRAYGDYPVGAMHMEIRKSVLELSKFDDVSGHSSRLPQPRGV